MLKATRIPLPSFLLTVVLIISLAGSVMGVDCPVGDLDGDCRVDWYDMEIFTSHWLESPGVVVETEDYSSKTDGSGSAAGSSWVELAGDGSSGAGYMRALPDDGLTIDTNIEAESPHLGYGIRFPTAGTYYLWLKGWAEDRDSDGIHYGLDGSAVSSGLSDSALLSLGDAFAWRSQRGDGSRPTLTIDSTGLHTLDIWMRKDGAKLDRVLLITDVDYIPGVSELPADLNGDNKVDMTDYAWLAEDWLVVTTHECENWQTLHPDWLFCDDFETEQNLRVNYHDRSENGMFVSTNDAFGGSYSLEQHYTLYQINAGWVARFIGDNPHLSSPGPKINEVYFRWYHKFEDGFTGLPPKMARIKVFMTPDDWSGALGVYQWIAGNNYLCADKRAYSYSQGEYYWLPITFSTLDYSDPANIGRWICIEARVKLDAPGANDGEIQYWADGEMILSEGGLNLGNESYAKGLNMVMWDCYWNSGSPAEQSRFYDNLVISTAPIGPYCGGGL